MFTYTLLDLLPSLSCLWFTVASSEQASHGSKHCSNFILKILRLDRITPLSPQSSLAPYPHHSTTQDLFLFVLVLILCTYPISAVYPCQKPALINLRMDCQYSQSMQIGFWRNHFCKLIRRCATSSDVQLQPAWNLILLCLKSYPALLDFIRCFPALVYKSRDYLFSVSGLCNNFRSNQLLLLSRFIFWVVFITYLQNSVLQNGLLTRMPAKLYLYLYKWNAWDFF